MNSLLQHRLIVEAHHLRILILEGRLDFLEKNMLPRIEKALPAIDDQVKQVGIQGETPPEIAKAVFAHVIEFDPDPVKKNSQWLLTLLVKGKLKLEDLEKATRYLKRFAALKSQLPTEGRDINRYTSLSQLYTAIEPPEATADDADIPQSQREIERETKQKMLAECDVIYNDPEYRILVPKTKAASCYFGINTEWCTAATSSRNYFDDYHTKGPLYIILDKKNNKRWQFHFETRAFMDETDSPINVQTFLQQHPTVAAVFEKLEDDLREIGRWNDIKVFFDADKHKLVFKQKRGPFFKIDGSIKADDDNEIESSNVPRGEAPGEEGKNTDTLIAILNKVGFKDEKHAMRFSYFNVYYGKGKFGKLEEVGKAILEFPDGLHWVGLKGYAANSDNVIYALELVEKMLVPGVADPVFDATIIGGVFDVSKLEKDNDKIIQMDDHLLDLIAKLKTQIVRAESTKYYDHMSTEQIARLAKIKPEFVSLKALHKLKGNSKGVRNKIEEKLNNEDISFVGWAKGFKSMIMKEYSSIDDFIGDNGTEFMRRVADQFNGSGNERFEFHTEGSDDDAESLYEKLSPELRKKIGKHIATEYETEDDDEEIDPNDEDQVWRVIRDNDHDVMSALRNAVSRGLETGAEDDMYQDYVKALEYVNDDDDQIVHIEFTTGIHKEGPKIGKTYLVHDGKVTVSMSFDKLIEVCGDEDALSGLRDELIKPIDIDEPQYGWSGFDDEAALEAADEFLGEILD